MTVDDLSAIPDRTRLEADICIVGSGPAGISIALQFLRTDISVVIVESGGTEPDFETDDLSEIESTGLARAPQDVTRARVVGGTSSLWTGRCGVVDEMDLARRPWVPDSGWPIGYGDLQPYTARASTLLGLGPARNRGPAAVDFGGDPDRPWDPRLLEPLVFQFSLHDPSVSEPVRAFASDGVDGAELIGALQHAGAPRPVHFGDAHLEALRAAPNIRMLTHGSVRSIRTDAAGTAAAGVDVAALDGRRVSIDAPHVVLCCGGVDNARLLLASHTGDGRSVGNRHDTVGRYLMDHPLATIGSYHGAGDAALRRRFGHRWVDRRGIRHVYTIGARVAAEVQRREELLNASIHALDFGDRDAVLPELRDAARRLSANPRDATALRTVARLGMRPDRVAHALYERYSLRRPSLTPAERVDFACVVEQVPDRDSRITLSDRTDALGMPRARIHWRASDDEFRTLVRVGEIFDSEARRLGYLAPERVPWEELGVDAWRESIHDMAHPIGSTRMSVDPRRGVVDTDCQVHDVRGLFVAGGSVFPTPGYINPTFMIVTLALRTADHIRGLIDRERARAMAASGGSSSRATSALSTTDPRPRRTRRLRVGLVGAGDRIRSYHLPVLRALADRYEIVGAVGGPGRALHEVAAATGVEAFADPGTLVAGASPDLLVVGVATHAIDTAIGPLVELGVPLLLETPLCWRVRSGRDVVARIRELELPVGVAEQTPFLPVEQVKSLALQRGVIGPVEAVDNDGRYFEHHALAALRTHLAGERRPERALSTGLVSSGRAGDGSTALLSRSHVVYSDGAMLRHCSYDGQTPSGSAHFRIDGADGSFVDESLVVWMPGGATWSSSIERVTDGGRLRGVRLELPDGEVTWDNPFRDHDLDDERIAIATLLDAMRDSVFHGTDPLYTPEMALIDIEMAAAFHSAGRSGAAVPLPLRPRREQLRRLSPRTLGRTARRQLTRLQSG